MVATHGGRMAKILALSAVVIACFFDPLQQVLLKGRYDGTVGWWEFHLVHWAAFYPPLVWIVLRQWKPAYIHIPERGIVKTYKIYRFLGFSRWYSATHCCGGFIYKNIITIAAITVLAWLVWQAGLYAAGSPWTSMWLWWMEK
jgi:hypothetical protein